MKLQCQPNTLSSAEIGIANPLKLQGVGGWIFQGWTSHHEAPVCKLGMQEEGEPPKPSGLLDQMPAINECFDFDSLQEIYAALERRKDAWSRETLDTLHK